LLVLLVLELPPLSCAERRAVAGRRRRSPRLGRGWDGFAKMVMWMQITEAGRQAIVEHR
jgi:hypothetical protein